MTCSAFVTSAVPKSFTLHSYLQVRYLQSALNPHAPCPSSSSPPPYRFKYALMIDGHKPPTHAYPPHPALAKKNKKKNEKKTLKTPTVLSLLPFHKPFPNSQPSTHPSISNPPNSIQVRKSTPSISPPPNPHRFPPQKKGGSTPGKKKKHGRGQTDAYNTPACHILALPPLPKKKMLSPFVILSERRIERKHGRSRVGVVRYLCFDYFGLDEYMCAYPFVCRYITPPRGAACIPPNHPECTLPDRNSSGCRNRHLPSSKPKHTVEARHRHTPNRSPKISYMI